MNIRFDGLTIAVTGAGHGYGRAIARSFAALGGKVQAVVPQKGMPVTI